MIHGAMAHQVVTAMIFIPAALTHDSRYAREGIEHIARRGYRLGGIFRLWENLEYAQRECASTGGTIVTVFARADHYDPRCVGHVELVGEETRDLTQYRRNTGPGYGPPHGHAARLVEDAARRLGFPPRDVPRHLGR